MITFNFGNQKREEEQAEQVVSAAVAAEGAAEPKIENKPTVGFNLAPSVPAVEVVQESVRPAEEVQPMPEEKPVASGFSFKMSNPTPSAAAAVALPNPAIKGETLADLAGPEEDVSIHIGVEEEIKKEEEVKKKKMTFKEWTDDLNRKLGQMTAIKTKEITTFFRLMATMQNAGITLLKALKIMRNQTPNMRFQTILEECVGRVEEGGTFSDCLRDYPTVFDESSVGMIASGEASGRLSRVLVDIADMMEKNDKLRSKIKSALLYPVVVMIVLFIAAIVVMVMIVPKFVELFDQMGGALPTSTQVLISMSEITQQYWWAILFAPVALMLAIRQFKKTEYGRLKWDYFMLVIPVFGTLNKKVALSRFSASLASMSEAGIAIVKALQINADSIGNHVYRNRILQIRDDVEQGIPISENIKNDTFLFPDLVVSMIDVGEQTATIAQVSRKVAEFYDAEVDTAVKNLTTAMEPFIIVVMATAVGGLVAAIMQPIFEMTNLASSL